jgi:hypothetical protein
MSENNVWPCTWEQSKAGITIRVQRGKTSLRVTKPSLDKAIMAMQDEICGAFGDGEAVLDPETPFPPYTPSAFATYGTHVELGYNAIFFLLNYKQRLWEQGWCDWCDTPLGKRTDMPLHICIEEAGDIIFSRTPSKGSVVVSKRFLGALSPQERSVVEVRPVVAIHEERKVSEGTFMEMIPKRPIQQAWPRDLKPKPAHCPSCKQTLSFGTGAETFIRREDLGSASLAVIDNAFSPSLVFALGRWRELRKQGVTHQVGSSTIGIVNAIDCIEAGILERVGTARDRSTRTTRQVCENSIRLSMEGDSSDANFFRQYLNL